MDRCNAGDVTPLTGFGIARELRALGLGPGDIVKVHSSLRSLGWVDGGAQTVVDALMQVVGEGGALVMPAFPVSLPIPVTEAESSRGIAWKVRRLDPNVGERSGMGAIADELRRRPGAVLGTGLHRVCAWGRDAEMLSEGFGRLLEADAKALLIGVDIHHLSSMHHAEARVGLPEAVASIWAVSEDILRDYPTDRWVIGCGQAPEDGWSKVWQRALERELVRQGRIGQATCSLFRARGVVGIYEQCLRDDPASRDEPQGLFGITARSSAS